MSGVSVHASHSAGRLTAVLALAALAVGAALFATAGRGDAAGNMITSPDSGGRHTSIALDAAGFPVVSHYDPSGGDLKIVHCGDASCSSGNSLAAPDTTNNVGLYSSLELDASGDPVVSYQDGSLFDARLLRCGNPNCTSGNTTTSPDSSPANSTGLYSSLALDSSDNAVVSYFEVPHDGLRVLRCNNASCSSYSATFADPGNIVGLHTSIVLDAAGFPVVSYYDQTNGYLKVVHCGNAICSSGNTIVSPDTAVQVGEYTSIALDASGFPVVSYYGQSGGDLKVLHCGNGTCSSGNSITSPDTANDVGKYTSLRLDALGNPVVSYYSSTGGNLRVLHCGNANCSAGNVSTTPDSTGDVGQYTSLALDALGFPVVSYYDATNGMLKVLHCGDAICSASVPPTATPTATPMAVGGFTELPDIAAGGGRGGAMWSAIATVVGAVGVAGALAWRRLGRRARSV